MMMNNKISLFASGMATALRFDDSVIPTPPTLSALEVLLYYEIPKASSTSWTLLEYSAQMRSLNKVFHCSNEFEEIEKFNETLRRDSGISILP